MLLTKVVIEVPLGTVLQDDFHLLTTLVLQTSLGSTPGRRKKGISRIFSIRSNEPLPKTNQYLLPHDQFEYVRGELDRIKLGALEDAEVVQ